MDPLQSPSSSQSAQVDVQHSQHNEPSTIHYDGEERNEISTDNVDDDDEEDNMTEINVDDVDHENGQVVSRLERARNSMVQNWTPAEEEEFVQARREHLHQELIRIQRTNFYHFGLICLVPLAMLILVVMTSFNQDASCEADIGTECFYENKGFMNAFARQCICRGVVVVAG